jgi:hypothetical protein
MTELVNEATTRATTDQRQVASTHGAGSYDRAQKGATEDHTNKITSISKNTIVDKDDVDNSNGSIKDQRQVASCSLWTPLGEGNDADSTVQNSNDNKSEEEAAKEGTRAQAQAIAQQVAQQAASISGEI